MSGRWGWVRMGVTAWGVLKSGAWVWSRGSLGSLYRVWGSAWRRSEGSLEGVWGSEWGRVAVSLGVTTDHWEGGVSLEGIGGTDCCGSSDGLADVGV